MGGYLLQKKKDLSKIPLNNKCFKDYGTVTRVADLANMLWVQFPAQPSKKKKKVIIKLGIVVAHTCNSSIWEMVAGTLQFQGEPRHWMRHCLKRPARDTELSG